MNELYDSLYQQASLIARLAIQSGFNAGIALNPNPQPGFSSLIVIDLPAGQIQYLIPDTRLRWFNFLGKYLGTVQIVTAEMQAQRLLTSQFPTSLTLEVEECDHDQF